VIQRNLAPWIASTATHGLRESGVTSKSQNNANGASCADGVKAEIRMYQVGLIVDFFELEAVVPKVLDLAGAAVFA
jgi:hypothetical protein